MRLLGLDISFSRAKPDATERQVGLSPVFSSMGSWPSILEPFSGAWQRNIEVSRETALSYYAVFACVTRIAGDIGKLTPRLMEQDNDGIWHQVESPAFSPLLRRPNHYQTWQKFAENWIINKLVHGNAYPIKQRDGRRVVTALYLPDPQRVRPLVAQNGDVYYAIGSDNLARLNGVDESSTLPASEVIHDPMIMLFHPLVGVSPIYACGLGVAQGIAIQNNSARFFKNMSRPSGVLTAPGQIKDETAARLKAYWEQNYSSDNIGKLAVLGDGLKYEPMTITAHDAQLIEQLKWTADMVCSVFHVPAHMVGVGPPPAYNNISALNQQYYSQCLQVLIESMEAHLNAGLGLDDPSAQGGRKMRIELDLDGLLRMDSATQIDVLSKAVGGAIMAPNEARIKRNLRPVTGGDTVYLQQQNYSLAALDERDRNSPLVASAAAPAAPPVASPDEPVDVTQALIDAIKKGLHV